MSPKPFPIASLAIGVGESKGTAREEIWRSSFFVFLGLFFPFFCWGGGDLQNLIVGEYFGTFLGVA
jgi:hypothetical protein